MTLKGLFLRFFLAYFVLLSGAGYAMSHFDFKLSGLNVAILAGCIIWLCGSFAKKNKRYFTTKEKTMVVIGILGIDLLYQITFGVSALLNKQPNIEVSTLAISASLVGLLHLAVIYVFIGVTKKTLIKQGVISG